MAVGITSYSQSTLLFHPSPSSTPSRPTFSTYLSPTPIRLSHPRGRFFTALAETLPSSLAADPISISIGEEIKLGEEIAVGGGGGEGSGGDWGDGNGGGGGGGDREDRGEGGDQDEDGKKGGMSMSQKLTLGYAALVGVGGVMGYLKSGSLKSGGAGGLSALILYYVYTQLPSRPVFASSLGLGVSAALLGVMGARFSKSKKLFPAGIVSVVSFVMVGGYLHGILRSLHA